MSRGTSRSASEGCLALLALVSALAHGCVRGAESALPGEVRRLLGARIAPLEPPNYTLLIGRELNQEEVELGRLLFNDPILSRNNDASCGTCHLTNHGMADGMSLSIGSLGRGGATGDTVGPRLGEGVTQLERGFGDDGFGFGSDRFMFRNTLSSVNVAYRMDATSNSGLLHDGRFGNLFFQVLLPTHTPEELCGGNPIPSPARNPNPFREGGPLFREPVHLTHTNSFDPMTGQDRGSFNNGDVVVTGVPDRRGNGTISVPTRNECLAITVAKIRSVPEYRERFAKAFDAPVSDDTIGRAIASFLLTHVSIDTPYDRFAKGDDKALTESQLRGLVSFHTPLGTSVTVGGQNVPGAGCANCHSGPEFGGHGFAAVGVRSDRRSSQSRPTDAFDGNSGFFTRRRIQRGRVPGCHVKDVTIADSAGGAPYAPDIGRANATYADEDCFKFRIAPLRNVIETYPYFHHGTERAYGSTETSLEKRAVIALGNIVRYKVRGPIDPENVARFESEKAYFDDLYQSDPLVPFFAQNFRGLGPIDHAGFPYELPASAVDDVVAFVAYGLWDQNSMSRGAIGNKIANPTKVPSGFQPAVTRDEGRQDELPPNADIKAALAY